MNKSLIQQKEFNLKENKNIKVMKNWDNKNSNKDMVLIMMEEDSHFHLINIQKRDQCQVLKSKQINMEG